MTASLFGNEIKRTSELLKVGAFDQIVDYENRFEPLQTLYKLLLSDLIVSDANLEEAHRTAQEFFGSTTVRFAGIDGTMYSRPLFDLIIFFGGAYASTGTLTFSANATPTIEYDSKTLEQGAGISSVIPVYINEIPDIDQTFFSQENPREPALNQPLQDHAIASNATIANWIMTFAEYYLAYKLAADPDQNLHILLLDRSLSIDRASLLYDTSKRDLWKAKSSILGYETDTVPIDVNDLTLARQQLHNPALGLPPPRADYLRYAIINVIRTEGPLSQKHLLEALGIAKEQRAKRVDRYLKRSVQEAILIERGDTYTLNPKYVTTWKRVTSLVTTLGDSFFSTRTPTTAPANLMKIRKDGQQQWLTTLDIAFLTLFTLQMLIDACWKQHILLVGMTKDTAARDMKRQLIPILNNQGLLRNHIAPDLYQKLPNTDRMILQSTSLLNQDQIHVPWSLIEYDSAFRSMVPDPANREGHVLGAIKNRISLEKTFLKTYVQLAQAAKDPLLRSNVLLVDRLVYPAYDATPDSTVTFQNDFGGAVEPLDVILYKDTTIPNPMQNLTFTILTAMTPSSIPEAFGHNKPLFIADKIAKWHYSQFKRIADTTASWILNNHKLRKFVYYMSTFRERRAAIEAARRETL